MTLTRGEFSPAPYLNDERGAVRCTQHELADLVQASSNFDPRASSITAFRDSDRAAHYLEIVDAMQVGDWRRKLKACIYRVAR